MKVYSKDGKLAVNLVVLKDLSLADTKVHWLVAQKVGQKAKQLVRCSVVMLVAH